MYHHVIDRLGRQSKQKPTSLPKMECESKGRTNINRLSSSTWSFLPITWVMMLYILRSTACHNSCADTYSCLDKRLKKISDHLPLSCFLQNDYGLVLLTLFISQCEKLLTVQQFYNYSVIFCFVTKLWSD